jgi:gas vesicle protein
MSDDRGGVGAGTVLLAGVLGGLAGAALGLLLAPKAGAELRSELGDRAKSAGERAREWAEIAREKAEEALAAAHRCCTEAETVAEAEGAAEGDAVVTGPPPDDQEA